MNSCLSTEPILCRILSKLNLREKFGVQRVSRRWKDIAIQCLRHHEYLVISENLPTSFWSYSNCEEHLSSLTIGNNDNLIWGKRTDLEFWQKTLSLFQAVKYVYVDVTNDDGSNCLFQDYRPMLQLLMDSCRQSLECLCIPGHNDNEDQTFPLTDSLPSLKHMILGHTTSRVTRNILSACPNIQCLRSGTSFTNWEMLPKGFKKLEIYSENSDGMNNLLSSPAVESLEAVKNFVMTGEINYQPYHFSCLKEFYVNIDLDMTNCLTDLARILSVAPVLCQLMISMAVFDEIESQLWIKILSGCQNITHLTVCLHDPVGTDNPITNASSWQDDFAKTIVSKMKKLEHLYIDFHLSSDGLRLLSRLENLQYFCHQIYIENLSYDSVFDTDALVYFLSQALPKKLTSYMLSARSILEVDEYIILKESFLDFAYKMEQQYFIRLDIRQDDRYCDTERPHPEKIPGMIYVVDIISSEWDLLYPDMYSDEEENNLLFSLMATQSYVQNILLESNQE